MNATEALTLKRAWIFSVVAALVGGYLFLRPFLAVIALALLCAYLSNPLYKKLEKKLKNKRSLAAALTGVIAFILVGIPIIALIILMAFQALRLVDQLGLNQMIVGDVDISGFIQSAVYQLNAFIEKISGVKDVLKANSIVEFTKDNLPQFFKALANLVFGIVSGIPTFFMQLIIFLFVYFGILLGQKKLLYNIRGLVPFDKKTTDLYLQKIGLMTKSMVKGQLFISFVQGVAGALSLIVVGMGDFLAIFIVLFTFMNLIPLGSGIITIPLGIAMILFGDIWAGSVILLTHFIVVTNIDNILRPRFVPKEAKLSASLTILSALAGVRLFGLLGVVYGPIIMILITTTIESYVEFKKLSYR